MEWYEAHIIANEGDEHTSLVDLRTLPAGRLAGLILEAGEAGDSALIDSIARLLSDRALDEGPRS